MMKKIFGRIYIGLALLLMYLPVLVIIVFSFSSQAERINFNFADQPYVFGFDLYSDLFFGPNSEKIMIALGNTLLIAFISATVATLLGTLGAIGAYYSKRKRRATYDMMTQIPMVNAEIVIAFSLTVMFVFLGTYIFKDYLFGFWTLLIGHVVLAIPFVYTSVKPKLQQMDPSLYEAAIDLGASPSLALRKVVIREAMPGILSGFLLSITLSLDDFIITAFTRGSGLLSGESMIETLSTYVQAKIKKTSIPPELWALTTFIFIAVLVAVIFVSIYRKSNENKEKVRKGRAKL